MKPEQWEQFKEAIAKDIQCQYPKVDYLLSTVYNAIERHKGLLEDAPPQAHSPDCAIAVNGRHACSCQLQDVASGCNTLQDKPPCVPVVCEWVRHYNAYIDRHDIFRGDLLERCPRCGLPVVVKGGGM